MHGSREGMLDALAREVASVAVPHPVRVAVDGRPASGKTTLADELAERLRNQGAFVIRASIESFLLPRAVRYRRGELSAAGNYYDSFDYARLKEVLLDPLGPGGEREYYPAIYDERTDRAVVEPFMSAPAEAVLIFEGVFLLRPELIDTWDLSIFVSVEFEETVARARQRDKALYGGSAEAERRFRTRYGPSQDLYFDLVSPLDQADIVVCNDRPSDPAWTVRSH